MSLSTKKKARIATIIGILFTLTSCADFTASENGTVEISTATSSLNPSESYGNNDTFKLNYAILSPGSTVIKTFRIKNASSIPTDGKLDSSIPILPAGLTANDLAKLKVSVNGAVPIAATSLPTTTSIGALAPGQTKAVDVAISLDYAAGNEWQNKKVMITLCATLTQQYPSS